MRKLAVALVALLVLAGCEGLQKASNRATCAVAAQTCITLYSGGATLAAYKDPSSIQPTPLGLQFIDAQGNYILWSGDYMIRSSSQ